MKQKIALAEIPNYILHLTHLALDQMISRVIHI